MAWISLGQPALFDVDGPALILVVLVCSLVEGFALLVRCYAKRFDSVELGELEQRQKYLKVEVRNTNYPEMFVKNSKLQRQLLQVEKKLEQLKTRKAIKVAKFQSLCRFIKLPVYGLVLTAYWGMTLVTLEADATWPLTRMTKSPLEAAEAGAVTATGIIMLFQLGVASRVPWQ
ncbi:unnamed protein product [Chrysoparadoxa australica]